MNSAHHPTQQSPGAAKWTGIALGLMAAIATSCVQWGVIITRLGGVETTLSELRQDERLRRERDADIVRRITVLETIFGVGAGKNPPQP